MEPLLDPHDIEGADDRECLRCGSLLPPEDEGLCPTCGTEYGRATLAMAALPKPEYLERSAPAADHGDSAGNVVVDPRMVGAMPETGASNSRTILLWIMAALCVLIALGVVAVAVVLLLNQMSSESTPPPTPPPAETIDFQF